MQDSERWHVNCYWKGTTELADARAFEERGQAGDYLKQLLETDAQCVWQLNERRLAQYAERLREFVLELDGVGVCEAEELPLTLVEPLTRRYEYRVELCANRAATGAYCVACCEAGLIAIGNVRLA